jgi:hypothetical protein
MHVSLNFCKSSEKEATINIHICRLLRLKQQIEFGTWKGRWQNWLQKLWTSLYLYVVYSSMFFVVTESKKRFLYSRWKCVLYDIIYHILQFSFLTSWNSELLKLQMTELLSMNHHRAPPMDQWSIHETKHSLIDVQYCITFSSCLLNVKDLSQCLLFIL